MNTNKDYVDPRWIGIAETWLDDYDVRAASVKKYAPKLAQILHDQAEQFVESDLPQLEQDADDAARDAHEQRQLDELRGK